MTGRILARDVDPTLFPMRVTYLRDGEVVETHVVAEPGVLQISGGHGPGVVCVVEFGDGGVEAARAVPDQQPEGESRPEVQR